MVLQLDICSFTQLAQRLSPAELAAVTNRLFSRFDDALASCMRAETSASSSPRGDGERGRGRGEGGDYDAGSDRGGSPARSDMLFHRRSSAGHFIPSEDSMFKVDTIGDAYVVVCWLPKGALGYRM